MAIVSSAAAAGVHAAVGPAHYTENALFGLFFAGSALAQIGWAAAMVIRPSRALLEVAVLGNLAVVALWAVTRTVGLGALLPAPEGVGTWDTCCAIWEVSVALTCACMLRTRLDPRSLRLPRWGDWHPAAQAWVLGSALVLGALSISGATA
jgi:hypothetical protein